MVEQTISLFVRCWIVPSIFQNQSYIGWLVHKYVFPFCSCLFHSVACFLCWAEEFQLNTSSQYWFWDSGLGCCLGAPCPLLGCMIPILASLVIPASWSCASREDRQQVRAPVLGFSLPTREFLSGPSSWLQSVPMELMWKFGKRMSRFSSSSSLSIYLSGKF